MFEMQYLVVSNQMGSILDQVFTYCRRNSVTFLVVVLRFLFA